MKPEDIYKKLYDRVTESRWTMMYISFAIFQMIVSIAIEAIILQKNEQSNAVILEYSAEYDDSKDFVAYKNYTYIKYSLQFQSIIHENIWFMVFEAFLTALCFSAVFFQNSIEVISIILINISLIFLGGVQIYQSKKWIDRVNTDIIHQELSDSLSMDVVLWDAVQLVLVLGFTASSIFFGYKLYKQFGWNIYKEIGANIQTQRMYRTYLVFVLLLKLDICLLMGFQILNLVFLFNDETEEQTRTIIFQSVMVAAVIPMVGLALWGVRRENKVAILIFVAASSATIVNLLFILAKFIINKDENLLTLLDIVGILMSITSIVFAYLVARNFDRGLKEYFQRKGQDDVNLESRRKRITIDDDD